MTRLRASSCWPPPSPCRQRPRFADDGAATSAQPIPAELSPEQRQGYRAVFAAIRASDWAGRIGAARRACATGRCTMSPGPSSTLARDRRGSSSSQLLALLAARARTAARRADSPASPRLAARPSLPALPQAAAGWSGLGSQPRRARADAIKGDPAAAELEPLIQPLIATTSPSEAEALLQRAAGAARPEARTEFQQRIAWSYYIDRQRPRRAAARRRRPAPAAANGRSTATGSAGLAAWRDGRLQAAPPTLSAMSPRRSTDIELAAAGHYWAARADMRCGQPERVQAHLRSAARQKETFYGLLAAERARHQRPRRRPGCTITAMPNGAAIAGKPNVRAAVALAEIGETDLADQLLRHQARIGGAGDHNALLHLAADLNLAAPRLARAQRAARRQRRTAARYPEPDWRPARGWRVDQALVFAHALQESNFRPDVVSPAGARGLMQVRPGTAGDIARARGEPFDRAALTIPPPNRIRPEPISNICATMAPPAACCPR